MGSYDDGIYIYFGDKKPQHITYSMWTDDPDIETCDFRLTSIDRNATISNATTNSTTNTTVKTNTTTTNKTTVVIP